MDTAELVSLSERFLAQPESVTRDDLPKLRDVIREHSRRYYTDEASVVVSDVEYDRIYALLVSLEKKYGDRPSDSPTVRVGTESVGTTGESEQFSKKPHASPMLSLDNTYDSADVREFETRIRNILDTDAPLPYRIEYKFDGLGLSLTYRGGQLVRALTRGNGTIGEDVTANARVIANIPKTIACPLELEIRGEVIFPHAAFAKLNADRLARGEKLFANPRNAASGSVRQLDARITASRGLEFYAYSCPFFESEAGRKAFEAETGRQIATYGDYIAALSWLGFASSEIFFERFENVETMIARIEKLVADRPRPGFDTDGLVIKLDDLPLWNALGMTAHHPRYAIAYKFPAETVRTRVRDVLHSVGRSGAVTPVAILDPVAVGGVIVGRATLHNYSELAQKDVRIGDSVFLVRAGEVIPDIVSAIPEIRDGSERIVERPDACPACGTPLRNDEGKIAWYCPNRASCPAQVQGGLETFVGKYAMDIDGLGTKQLELFREKGLVSDFASVYRLAEHREILLGLPGFKRKSVDNLLGAIETARRVPLDRLLVALGIPGVGRRTAKSLAEFLAGMIREQDADSVEKWLLAVTERLVPDLLESVRDLGPVGATSIVGYFAQYEGRISDLLRELEIVLPDAAPLPELDPRPLAGKSFAITGSFEGYSRDDLSALGEAAGGKFRTGVTRDCAFLLAGEKAGSKADKAASLGVSVWSLAEFLKAVETR